VQVIPEGAGLVKPACGGLVLTVSWWSSAWLMGVPG
jgi:hypothetical protein